MRFKSSLAIEDLEGKAGSVVIKKNNAFGSVLPVVVPRQPRTQKIMVHRQNIKSLNWAWSKLSDAQRLAWTRLSKNEGYGKTKYTSYNSLLYWVGADKVDDPGSSGLEYEPIDPSVEIDIDNKTIGFHVNCKGTDMENMPFFYYVVYAEKGHPSITNFDEKNARVIFSDWTKGENEYNLWDAYVSVFGEEPKQGYHYNFRCRLVQTDNVVMNWSEPVSAEASGSVVPTTFIPYVSAASLSEDNILSITISCDGDPAESYLYLSFASYRNDTSTTVYAGSNYVVRVKCPAPGTYSFNNSVEKSSYSDIEMALMCAWSHPYNSYYFTLRWGIAPVSDPDDYTLERISFGNSFSTPYNRVESLTGRSGGYAYPALCCVGSSSGDVASMISAYFYNIRWNESSQAWQWNAPTREAQVGDVSLPFSTDSIEQQMIGGELQEGEFYVWWFSVYLSGSSSSVNMIGGCQSPMLYLASEATEILKIEHD